MVADDNFLGAMRCVGMAARGTKQTETLSSVTSTGQIKALLQMMSGYQAVEENLEIGTQFLSNKKTPNINKPYGGLKLTRRKEPTTSSN